jgi:hypothetical protein
MSAERSVVTTQDREPARLARTIAIDSRHPPHSAIAKATISGVTLGVTGGHECAHL